MSNYERTWLAWLSKSRIFAITCMLAIEFCIVNFTPAAHVPMRAFVFAISIWYTVAAFFILLHHLWDEFALQARLHVLSDLAFGTVLIYLSGGIDTSLNFVYPLIIIVASIVLPSSWAFITASLAFVCFGAVLEAAHFGVIRSYSSSTPDLRMLQVVVLTNLFAYFAIAYLATRLNARLRSMRLQYERQHLELEALQAMHGTIVRSVSSGLVTTDLRGNVTLVNPAGERLLERMRGKCVGVTFNELLGSVPPAPGAHRIEVRYVTPAGAEKVFGVSASLLVGENGPGGHLYAIDDLTEMRRLENEVRTSDRLAAVGRMAAGIAHEIRNPLTSIGGSAMMLRECATLDDEQAMLMDIVIRESERLNNIVTDFLTYARDKEMHFEPVDLLPLLEDTAYLLQNREEALSGRVSIVTDFRVAEAWSVADGERLKQVFWNICHNALRAMTELDRDASKHHELRIAVEQSAAGWSIRFSDSGPGMRPQQMEKIFEPFQSGFAGGTGLGLAIVYQIIQAHEGHIKVQSQLGHGTEFSVELARMTPQAALTAAMGEVARG